MTKIYTVPYGKVIFIIMGVSLILTNVLGIVLLPKLEGILLICLFDILYVICLIIFFKFHFLNYIKISADGVTHKNIYYSWNDVFITMDYTIPNITRNTYTYRIYFNNSYITKEEVKNADKKGFCIDLNSERTRLILEYYKKPICILRETSLQKKVYELIIEHNLLYK